MTEMELSEGNKIILSFILSLTVLFLCSFMGNDDKIDYPLDVVCVKKQNLLVILDSIIDSEKKCDYYSSDLLFSISILNDNNILIGSIGDRIVDPDSKDGCFEYKDHLFFVSNIDNRFFKKTRKKRNYVFSKSLTEFDEEGNLLVVDADEWFQNDSYSYWYYTYKDDSFVFESKSTYCDKAKEK
jgi:hypothetical protein